MRILLEKTDEDHTLSANELISALEGYGIKAERKSVYSDIELLRTFGLDIEYRHKQGYFIASRQFELAELKLLVDAVLSSRFISQKKSEDLIKKLASVASEYEARQLKRQLFVADRAKTVNEVVLYSVDAIHEAINGKRKISFRYFDYDTSRKQVYRRAGEPYTHTPVSLCWADDNYYLIAYNAKYDGLTHYRVDRMTDVTVCDDASDKFDTDRFNVAEHTKMNFGMFSGEVVRATLAFDLSLVNVVLDRFGKDVQMRNRGSTFEITVDVSASPVFLAWMFQFGERAEIKSPDNLIGAMRGLLDSNSIKYT